MKVRLIRSLWNQWLVPAVVGAGAVDDHGRFARAELAGKGLDFGGGQAGSAGDLVERVVGQFLAEHLEDGGDFDASAVGQGDRVSAGEGGIEVAQAESFLL
jgi:hypothetical protein